MTEYAIGTAAVPLLKGVVYADTQPAAWETLLAIPGQVRDYLATIGLSVEIDEAERYAYIRQREPDGAEASTEPGGDSEGGDPPVPNLVPRRQLSFRVSLLLALLRGRLLELDAQGDQTRLVLTRDEIIDLVRTYRPREIQEARLVKETVADIEKLQGYGFVRALRDQHQTYEVRRVIKAFVDAQWLADFDRRLAEYVEIASEQGASHE